MYYYVVSSINVVEKFQMDTTPDEILLTILSFVSIVDLCPVDKHFLMLSRTTVETIVWDSIQTM